MAFFRPKRAHRRRERERWNNTLWRAQQCSWYTTFKGRRRLEVSYTCRNSYLTCCCCRCWKNHALTHTLPTWTQMCHWKPGNFKAISYLWAKKPLQRNLFYLSVGSIMTEIMRIMDSLCLIKQRFRKKDSIDYSISLTKRIVSSKQTQQENCILKYMT